MTGSIENCLRIMQKFFHIIESNQFKINKFIKRVEIVIYTFLRVSNLESLPDQRKVALLLNQRAVNSLDDLIFFNEDIEVILKF